MAVLFARAGIGAIPGASRLPLIGADADHPAGQALTLEDVESDLERLVAYQRVCGIRRR